MHIIFLKFGPNRAQASQWMAEHVRWIKQGIEDGVFLLAGSLESAAGGAVLAVNLERAEIDFRVSQDPFVIHRVVTPEVHTVSPSLISAGMGAVLGGSGAPSSAS